MPITITLDLSELNLRFHLVAKSAVIFKRACKSASYFLRRTLSSANNRQFKDLRNQFNTHISVFFSISTKSFIRTENRVGIGHTPALDHNLDRKIRFRNHKTELCWRHDYKVIYAASNTYLVFHFSIMNKTDRMLSINQEKQDKFYDL